MIRPMPIQIKTIAISVTNTASTSVALPSTGNTGNYVAYISIGSVGY